MKNKCLLVFAMFSFLTPLVAQDLVKTSHRKTAAYDAESFRSVTFDGGWCWFSDPRAVYFEGKHKRTYTGWIDSYGDIHIAYYDHDNHEIKSKVLYDKLETDDHDNPVILINKDGKLNVFFSKHAKNFPIQLYQSKYPEDIIEWQPPVALAINDTEMYKGLSNTYTYQNPVYLSEEDRYYIFWRGADFKPNYAVSDDGVHFGKGKIFVLPERVYRDRRPYMKVSSDGKSRIDFAFTDGHPRDEKNNSIYYMYYSKGAFYRAGGQRIKSIGEPVRPEEADVVYDAGKSGNPKAWIWDVAQDKNGKPSLVYAKFPDSANHIYCYARWDGKKWTNQELVNAGAYFEKDTTRNTEKEPNYSGGLAMDHEDPSVLYLSVKRDSVFEIEKWTALKGGKKWEIEPITKGSSKDNIRPFPVRNATQGNPLQVLWLTNTRYSHYTNFQSAIKMGLAPESPSSNLDSAEIIAVMQKAADWQLANPSPADRTSWTWGAFYTGLSALYRTSHEDKYLNDLLNIGQQADWSLKKDPFNADQIVIGQSYLEAFMVRKDTAMLTSILKVLDMHLARPAEEIDVRFKENKNRYKNWSWCDALYMAPPAFARAFAITGKAQYLDYMDSNWWKTSDYLYSPGDSLFFRDDNFFDKKTPNGKRIFWGRGNGWVMGGLARIIPFLPESYKSRPKYIDQFRQMAYKILSLQQSHGLWTASLVDPESLPTGESSGSAFFTFALAWGINSGLLPRKDFGPAVKKAWQALVANVNQQGRLGYVQQIAGSPYPFYANQSHVYATGAFLLAGRQMIELVRTNN